MRSDPDLTKGEALKGASPFGVLPKALFFQAVLYFGGNPVKFLLMRRGREIEKTGQNAGNVVK